MALPEITAHETILAVAELLRKADPTLGLTRSLEIAYDADQRLRTGYRQEQARGTHHFDTQHAVELVAKRAREALAVNPCIEIMKRAITLQQGDPRLSEQQAIEQVLHDDGALYERYRTRDPLRHPWPVLKATPAVVDGDPLVAIQKRLAAGETLDQIAVRDPQVWEAYRKRENAFVGLDQWRQERLDRLPS